MKARTFLAAVLALAVVSSMAAAPVAASPDLDFSDDRVPNPYLEEDTLTIAEHNRSEMSSVLEYYGDDGAIKSLPATVNDSQDTPYTFRADQIEESEFHEFPRDSSAASTIDASEWTTSASGSDSVTVSQTDGATASGVQSIEVTATVATTGNTTTATYDNFSITKDPSKRVLRFVGNVDQLASGAHVEVRAVDSDGDYKAAMVNSTESASAANVIGTATGQGYVYQERLGDLSTQGSGDGTFDDIVKLEVVTQDADATLTIVGLDAESKSTFVLGETVDSNDETVTIEERYAGGDMSLSVTSLGTMGSTFDDAVLNEFRVSDVHYRFEDLSSGDDYSVEFSDADEYGSYERKLDVNARLEIPAAIDLSHSGLRLVDEQGMVDQRFATAEVAEGVGDQDFGNISSWSDVSGQYTDKGAKHALDDTVGVDKAYAVHLTLLLTQEEEDAFTSQPAAAGPVGEGSGGGIGGMIMDFFGTIYGKVTAIVGVILTGLGFGARGD